MINNFVYLALGTNLNDRAKNLIEAIDKLKGNGVTFLKSSPIYRTPALLLKNSPDEWNKPFLNCIIKTQTTLSPDDLLSVCKKIERELGRDFSKKWAPRPIDIDILIYKDLKIDSELLTIPHKAILDRYFLLDEMSFLCPEYLNKINYYNKEHQPIMMGILNITPDSFSDGNIYNNEIKFVQTFDLWEKEFVGIIDIGAESTNPKALPITKKEEFDRLKFVFDYIKNKKFSYFKPYLSIDTYNYETAKYAIENGFDIINDVNALKDERMLELIKNDEEKKYVLMHSLCVPPNKHEHINDINDIEVWLQNKIEFIEKNNISKNQIIFDVGIGFGKTPEQTLKLLQNIEKFHKYGIKILIGHSRKSFMKVFNNNVKTLDFETLALSLNIADKVDILRVHTPVEHQNALLAYRSLYNQYI